MNRWGILVTSQRGCEPYASDWMGVEGRPIILSEDMAKALAKAANEVNGQLWNYEAKELP